MDNRIVISTPPHVKSKRTTRSVMIDVLIALAPAAICGIVYFLQYAFILEITCVAFAVLAEFVYFFIAKGGLNVRFADARTKECAKRIKQLKKEGASEELAAEQKRLKELNAELRNTAFAKSGGVCKDFIKQFDFTSVVTGLILALIIPSSVNWYEAAIGAVFAIVIVKMVFGGTGRNIANPAAVGRVFMFISFSTTMNTFVSAHFSAIAGESAATSPTFLQGLLDGGSNTMSALDLLLGTGLTGCIGETCKIALIVGYIYLVARKVIKWWQPLLFIGAAGLVAVALDGFDFSLFLPYILSGGLMFGGIFMMTDYVTSPKGIYAQIVYYAAGGILVALLRHFTGLEVVSFIIIVMNLIVPLLDNYIRRKPFGYRREKKKKNNKKEAAK